MQIKEQQISNRTNKKVTRELYLRQGDRGGHFRFYHYIIQQYYYRVVPKCFLIHSQGVTDLTGIHL